MKSFRSTKYRSFIREKPCLTCGDVSCIEAHHEDTDFYNSGIGMKPHDTQCLPLCAACHNERHENPANEFYEKYNIDFKVQMVNLLTEFFQKG